MAHPNQALRTGGVWLAAASTLMLVVFLLHGPIAPDLEDQMAKIADAAVRWAVVHWTAAAALSLFAVSGLIVLTSHSRLTESFWSISAWALLTVGALWTVTTAVAETTVVADAAASGSTETFQAWWAFSEGKGNGFAFLALAVAVIAGGEARSAASVMPAWSAWIAVAAGAASFAGWALGMWFEIRFGSLVWVVSSIVMSLWTLWFGIVLTRSQVGAREDRHSLV